ncbi:hypothetical protein [Ottowia caeni]|uniref:hypothetical protein n=1 Tax=Ottowia caeni TaxID=2870339 RepID=UPI003D70388E
MTKRTTRNLPAIVLMTTALAWNVPLMAQSGAKGGAQSQPPENAAAPSGLTATPGSSPKKSDSSQAGRRDSPDTGLPTDLTPAMPSAGTSKAPSSSPSSGDGQVPTTPSKDQQR